MSSKSSRMAGRLRLLLATLVFVPAVVPAATEVHVSPNGDDSNPGTTALPVKTPHAAQNRVRLLIQGGLSDSVNVIFGGGTYLMDSTLELRPEDSGTNAFPVTWKAATGASVILSGGKNLSGAWINAGDGTWNLDLPGIGLAANQWNFRELFVNGSRATRARFPNRDSN